MYNNTIRSFKLYTNCKQVNLIYPVVSEETCLSPSCASLSKVNIYYIILFLYLIVCQFIPHGSIVIQLTRFNPIDLKLCAHVIIIYDIYYRKRRFRVVRASGIITDSHGVTICDVREKLRT